MINTNTSSFIVGRVIRTEIIGKNLWKYCLSAIILYFRTAINSTGTIKVKNHTIKDHKHPEIGIVKCILGPKVAKKIIHVYEINMEKVTF